MPTTTGYAYDDLIAAIQTWAEDSSAELVAALPQIVSRGESRLYTDLDLDIFDRVRTGAFTQNQNVQDIKSSTWQATRSLYWTPIGGGRRSYLQRRSYEFCVDYEPDESNTGEPLYYAEYSATEFFVVPAPDAAYPFVLREITSDPALALSDSNQNTWLGDNAGDLLLDACMMEAEKYILSDQFDVNKWKTDYSEKLPQRRNMLRQLARSEYTPLMNAARTESDQP